MSGFIEQWFDRLTAKSSPVQESLPVIDSASQKVREIKQKMTRNKAGQNFCESESFQTEIMKLDEDGFTGLADALIIDALLIVPNLKNKFSVANRLLDRGRYKEAKSIFLQLKDEPQYAHPALTSLAKIAEKKNELKNAVALLQESLAWNYNDKWTHQTLKRLSQESKEPSSSNDDYYQLSSLLKGSHLVKPQYHLKRFLGKGGAATVYEGMHVTTKQEVAIKLFHHNQNQRHIQKALEEARFTAQIKHPHVVPIFDVVPQKGFLVMRYYSEGSLRNLLKRKRLTFSQAVDYAIVLLRTLGDIHNQGFAHLDIKPSNILLNDNLPLFSDFGIASKEKNTVTTGTHAYMAPEQKRGHIGQPNDIYALGLVLYECFTGKQPKGGINQIHLSDLPEGPKRKALENLLQPLLSVEAAKRPQNLHQLASHIALAAALPPAGPKALELFDNLKSWASSEKSEIQISMESHPIVAYLSGLDLKREDE